MVILARTRSDRSWWGIMMTAAVCAHAALASALPRSAPRPPPERTRVQLMDVDWPPPPTPLAPAADLPPPPAADVPHQPSPRRAAARAVRPSEPAPVLTRAKTSNPSDVLDLTDAIETGSGASIMGGATGPDAGALPGPAPVSAPATAQVSARPVPATDFSRKPALAGGAEWTCPFPSEADRAGVDSALVSIRIALDASGAVRNVELRSDPGHGFGGAAERCARTKRWAPALDRQGNAVAGDIVINVRFRRD